MTQLRSPAPSWFGGRKDSKRRTSFPLLPRAKAASRQRAAAMQRAPGFRNHRARLECDGYRDSPFGVLEYGCYLARCAFKGSENALLRADLVLTLLAIAA